MNLWRRISGFIRLLRPELSLSAGACVAVGEIIALGSIPAFRDFLLGFACGFCISGSALVLNDLFDLEVDRINAPDRPLPSGAVSPAGVVALAAVLTIIGLAAAAAAGPSAFVLGVVFWIVGVVYNWRMKATGIRGNIMVSASVAATFLLGGVIAGDPWNSFVWIFSGMAFFIDLGEEIAGDAMDIAGDSKRAVRSIAALHGKKIALRASAVMFAFAVAISLLPALPGGPGNVYRILISLTDLWIVIFTIRLHRSRTPEEGRRHMRSIYLGAMSGVLAFTAGQYLM